MIEKDYNVVPRNIIRSMILENGMENLTPTDIDEEISLGPNLGDYDVFLVGYTVDGVGSYSSIESGPASDVIRDLEILVNQGRIIDASINGYCINSCDTTSTLVDGTIISHARGRRFDRQRELISEGILEDPSFRNITEELVDLSIRFFNGDVDMASVALSAASVRCQQDHVDYEDHEDSNRRFHELVGRNINLNLIDNWSS